MAPIGTTSATDRFPQQWGNRAKTLRSTKQKPPLQMTELTDHQRWYREVYLFSEHWKNLRIQAFKEWGRHCHRCPATTRLDVHHLRYRRLYDVTVQDLQILCRKCHEREHTPPSEIAFHNLPAEIAQQIQRFITSGKPSSKNGRRNQAINRLLKQKAADGTLDPVLKMNLLCSRSGANARRYKALLAKGYKAAEILSMSKKKQKTLSK